MVIERAESMRVKRLCCLVLRSPLRHLGLRVRVRPASLSDADPDAGASDPDELVDFAPEPVLVDAAI